jgi:hypothetical protein
MSLRFGPAGVDTLPATNEPKFKTGQELKAFYKAQLAELKVKKRDQIKKMRKDVLDLLEGTGVTLREIYTYSEGSPKQPKQITYKLNDGSQYIYRGRGRLPAELRRLSKDQLKAREVVIQ